MHVENLHNKYYSSSQHMMLSIVICLSLTRLAVVLSNGNYSSEGPFRNWIKSNESLAQADQGFGVIYDELFDSLNIYLVGGFSCRNCVYRYNILSNTISSYDTLANGFYGVGDPVSVSINSTVYHITNGGSIISYDIVTGNEMILQTETDMKAGCINKHPTKRELYIKGSTNPGTHTNGATSTIFYIYDIDSDTLTWNNSLIYARNFPLCVVCSFFNICTVECFDYIINL